MDIIKNTDSNSELLTKIVEDWGQKQNPSFDELTSSVLQTHQTAQAGAIRAVNQMATLRNWLIGCYIVEYEQKGRDRAKYGDRLLKRLEESVNTKGLNVTLFKNSRRFYLLYPQIGVLFGKSPTSSDFLAARRSNNEKSPTASDEFITPPQYILSKLSFSHIIEIMTQDDPLARFFYETECIKGTWSVKELRRQIATNLYFRSGVSKDPNKLLATIKPETNTPALTIRQPYSFKIKVSAPNQKAYDKTMQMVSYVAEGARQDAYIENLGEVDDSEVTSESLLAKEYTPFIHKKENLKDWLENRLDEDMKDLGFTRQTTPTQKKKSEDTPVTGTITFLKGLSIGSGTLRIYHGSNDTTIAFEFLGLKAKDVITESDLEDALISHLQEFLLELGKGFCFEARQKRMIIDDEYYFADLVFYNRLLHCSVIVELKNDEFHHEYLGQLNAYVSYYKENEMHEGDNPPIGILLCTRKGKKMVEYAIAGMDNNLFVSTYMLQLPDKATLEKFLRDEMQDMQEQDL